MKSYHITADCCTYPSLLKLAEKTQKEQGWERVVAEPQNVPCTVMEEGTHLLRVRDMIDAAQSDNGQDIIVITRNDTCLASDAFRRIKQALQKNDACYSYDRIMNAIESEPIPDSLIYSGEDSNYSTMIAFRKSWWDANKKHYKGILYDRDGWDLVFRLLIDETHIGKGPKLMNVSYRGKFTPPCWDDKVKYNMLGNRVNAITVHNFLLKRKIIPEKFGF
jgi:hypothetical protein